MPKYIVIKGARANNLKNIDVKIPKDQFTVITGLSGSGKSSLAFDTVFAEGQRRYIESLSSYARMFLGQMEKPDVDFIEGLSPAISIDQKTSSKNPRSTVGTVTEIYDYARLLWANIGRPHCPKCGKPINRQSVDQITDSIMSLPAGTKIQILAPVIRSKKGEYLKLFENARKSGYVRARVDGIIYDLSETIALDKNRKHTIELVIDRLAIKEDIRRRLTDSVETALKQADGLVSVLVQDTGEELHYSQNFACDDCGISFPEFSSRMFSFNNPYGACKKCSGLGIQMLIDPDLIIPDKNLSINDGAIAASGWNTPNDNSIAKIYFDALAEKYRFSLDTPVSELSDEALGKILYGTGSEPILLNIPVKLGLSTIDKSFEGIIPNLERRYRETKSDSIKADIEACMSQSPCPVCGGRRLNEFSLAVTVGGLNISEFSDLSVSDALRFVSSLELTDKEQFIARTIIKEIKARLSFLLNVGLEYLTLSRASATLSGGESQRIRLASQIGSGLTGVLYILDEPSIGLHQRDNEKLINALKNLRDLGNTLIVVEHDEETMLASDYIIDMGPGAGNNGGEVIYQGPLEGLRNCPDSLTGRYLSRELEIPVPETRRKGNGKKITVYGASQNNLKNIDVSFPLGKFVCVTGVSGSGKSSLVNDILYNYLAAVKNRAKTKAGKFKKIDGLKYIDKVIQLDQSPIGRTPRSNPATYTGVFSDIRDLFSETKEAKIRGYGPGRFSFNVKGGRCESCQGDGIVRIQMHFMPDVYVSCDVCNGKRYNRETLEVRYKGKNINEVLEMTVDEAVDFFANQPKILRKIKTLQEVGLGYIKLGQPSTTLSGGEAQRIKLAFELNKVSTGSTLYLLDEPTTGLHFDDIKKLIAILERLVDSGNSIIVIEHNMDVIKSADWIIDLGPDGGDNGGTLVFEGTPEECCRCEGSRTGEFLKRWI